MLFHYVTYEVNNRECPSHVASTVLRCDVRGAVFLASTREKEEVGFAQRSRTMAFPEEAG